MTTPTTILSTLRATPGYAHETLTDGAILCDLDDSALFTVHVAVYGKKGNKTALAAMLQTVVDAGLITAEPYRLRTPNNRFSAYKNCTRYRITAAGLAI